VRPSTVDRREELAASGACVAREGGALRHVVLVPVGRGALSQCVGECVGERVVLVRVGRTFELEPEPSVRRRPGLQHVVVTGRQRHDAPVRGHEVGRRERIPEDGLSPARRHNVEHSGLDHHRCHRHRIRQHATRHLDAVRASREYTTACSHPGAPASRGIIVATTTFVQPLAPGRRAPRAPGAMTRRSPGEACRSPRRSRAHPRRRRAGASTRRG